MGYLFLLLSVWPRENQCIPISFRTLLKHLSYSLCHVGGPRFLVLRVVQHQETSLEINIAPCKAEDLAGA